MSERRTQIGEHTSFLLAPYFSLWEILEVVVYACRPTLKSGEFMIVLLFTCDLLPTLGNHKVSHLYFFPYSPLREN